MNLSFLIKDEYGNGGQSLSVIQGETRRVSLYFFNADGTPLCFQGTISEVVLKIMSQINQASVQKKLSLASASTIALTGDKSGLCGVQFTLTTGDTAGMPANNSGLSIVATITNSTGQVIEINCAAALAIEAPLVLT